MLRILAIPPRALRPPRTPFLGHILNAIATATATTGNAIATATGTDVATATATANPNATARTKQILHQHSYMNTISNASSYAVTHRC